MLCVFVHLQLILFAVARAYTSELTKRPLEFDLRRETWSPEPMRTEHAMEEPCTDVLHSGAADLRTLSYAWRDGLEERGYGREVQDPQLVCLRAAAAQISRAAGGALQSSS